MPDSIPALRPLHGFIHVEDIPVAAERATAAGIILTTVKEPRLRYGIVRALGAGPNKKGKPVYHQVKVGDVVVFDCYMGNQVDEPGRYYKSSWRVVDGDQLMAVVEDPPEDLSTLPPLTSKTAAS